MDDMETKLSDLEKSLTKDMHTISTADVQKCMADMGAEMDKVYEVINKLPKHDEKQIIDTAVSKSQSALLPVIVGVENQLIEATKPVIIRDSLESLEGDERLDKSAIKGLDEALAEKSKGGVTLFGNSRGVQLYVDGVKEGLAQTINFIPGVGISLTYNRSQGRNDITISASGTAALGIIAVSGTVDDSNVTFTAASEPTLLIINGGSYQKTGGSITWPYVAGTITLSSAVGNGGSIYGI